MSANTHARGSAASLLAAFVAVAALTACDDPEPTRPDCCPVIAEPESAVVSEPLAPSVAAPSLRSLSLNAESATDAGAPTAASAERFVYVSLSSGAYPAGTTALIRNTAGGQSVTQTMVEGGFDPVAILAGVGDTVAIDVRAGRVVLARIARPVPRNRRPSVVRTNPPKGKKDVALNSRVTIIFSEPIAANTLTASSLALSRDGVPIPGSIQVFAGGLAADFVPSVPLGPNASHRLVITQTIRDVEGDALEADVSVEFTTGSTTTPAVTTVEVTPPSATLEMGDVLGDSVQLASTVRSAQGIVTDREVIWSTSDPSVAVVSSGGLVKARGPGPATITARSEGQEGSAQIIVVPMPVAEVGVYVVGLTPTVSVGATVFVDAGTRDRNDQPLTRRLIEWQSSDVSVATVDQRGLVTGVAAGTVTITATSEGVSGTVGIAVGIPLMIDRVDIDPPVRVVPLGGIAQLTARAYRCDGGAGTCSEVTDAVTWASADPQVAVVDPTGRLTALRTGLVAITATVDDMQGTAAVTVVRPEPVAFASVDAGYYHTCGLTPSGEAYCWGQNVYASLGIGTWGLGLETSLVEHAPGAIAPLPVTGGLAFTSLSVGGWHACGLTSGGTVYCWGLALQNQLGQSGERGTHKCNLDGITWPCTPAPIPLSSALQFRSIHAGGLHTCGLTESGEAYCWGGDRYGQAGDGGGATHHGTMPTPVAGGHRFSTLSPGARYVCGITTEGKAYCWGYNYDGQLGDGTNVNRDSPVAVAGNLTFASISAIGQTTCAITTSGETYCWGDGYYGQLGDGGQSSSSYSPVAVRGGPFTSLAVGEFSACGLTSSGAAYCWGSNWRGMLGDGSRSQRDEPVAVAGGLTFASITSGASHVCGLTTSGVAYCWGWNASGQLGDGSAIDRATPVRVVGQP